MENETLELYARQKDLNLNIPKKVAVIGVGGVGSWAALDIALAGTKNLILVDHDKVEKHNLNRTPFSLRHIGEKKVSALSELIYSRRNDCEILPYCKKVEDLNNEQIEVLKEYEVVDCRDRLGKLPIKSVIKAGYDGFKATIHTNPNEKSVWGEGQTNYTITPSFIVPPQLLGSMITLYLCAKELKIMKDIAGKETINNFDVRSLFKQTGGEKDDSEKKAK